MAKEGILRTIRAKKPYPRAHENRVKISDPSIKGARVGLLKAASKTFIIIQLLFLCCFSYVFGSLYQQGDRVHQLNILFVDYDGGVVGGSFREAYQGLKGKGFPSLQEHSVVEYPSPQIQYHDVCHVDYWGALYITAGASEKVEAALTDPNKVYNESDIAYYIWNEARYPVVVDPIISSSMQLLSNVARVAFSKTNWTTTSLSPTAFQTFADPWHLTSIDIKPTVQGPRIVYNSLVVVFLLIQQFFFLGAINALYDAFNIYTRLNPHRIFLFRFAISTLFCLCGSLGVTGAIWAFRKDWAVDGTQFVLTWLTFWLFAHVNFLTLDVFTIWVPAPFVPMCLMSWIVFNVTSTLIPFELSSSFYRWGYALPAHNLYATLIDIWSGGCNPVLYYSLPTLFAFEVSSSILSALGIHRRCHYAMVKQDADAAAFQARVDMALQFEQKKLAAQREALRSSGEAGPPEGEVELARDREELSAEIERETTRARREMSRSSRAVEFGPSFGFN